MASPVAQSDTQSQGRSIQTIKDFEAAYVPKHVELRGKATSSAKAVPDLVSDALRSLRRTLR